MTFQEQAKDAQDVIGWTDYNNPGDMASAMIVLARVVVQIAGAVDRLQSTVHSMQAAL